jgi:hypothetical protein
VAVCSLWTDPQRREARVTIDREWQRSEAAVGLELLDLTLGGKDQFQAKDWASKPRERSHDWVAAHEGSLARAVPLGPLGCRGKQAPRAPRRGRHPMRVRGRDGTQQQIGLLSGRLAPPD